MQAARAYYASLLFTHEAVNRLRTYLEWEAEAPTGTKMKARTRPLDPRRPGQHRLLTFITWPRAHLK